MSRLLTWGTYRWQLEEGWHRLANCADRDDLDFHSEAPRSIKACKALCFPCPVKEICVVEALRLDDPWGIWGGLTGEERQQLVTGRSNRAPGIRPQHGHIDSYEAGCRCNLCSHAHEELEALRYGIAVIGIDLPEQRTADTHATETTC